MEILLKAPKPEDYIELGKSSGMGGEKSLNRAEIALGNSLLNVCIYENDKLIGYGRIVGDGAITFVVADIMVHKDYQRKGLGKMIMRQVDNYFKDNCNEECHITLLANRPADKLYSKFDFKYLQDFEVGMKRKNQNS
ncbi:GNAT family N-acetyltransferase [Miniphocaeibacter massiliensis]|uniref:GNAT family N-acetyltransferase n=1 Tax=Miniphocaeibacter massiliensis TaxID=2041841 RepID=UPI000C1C7771|nr:GNAT family N-acetyltransferase [Miniphocaeibacter massiliensis]